MYISILDIGINQRIRFYCFIFFYFNFVKFYLLVRHYCSIVTCCFDCYLFFYCKVFVVVVVFFIFYFIYYMAPRKYESGHQKLKKERIIEKLIESQKGALEKFVTSNKQNIIEKLGDRSTNELKEQEK
jgi:uncharacterized membrane protein